MFESDRIRTQMEAIFQSSYDGIWICDGQGMIVRLNPASERINSIKAEDWIGKHIRELESEEVIDKSVTMEVLKKRRPVTIFQTAKRTNKKLLVTGNPFFGEDGSIELVVTNDRDITELDNLRLRLLESEARTERFQHELMKIEGQIEAGGVFVSRSNMMRQILATAIHVAGFKTAVLISGASGTGKSLLAKLIHQNSDRKDKPFLRVECGAIPATLFESEVFGYEKGAFTGASSNGKLGLFEMAEGGTLFFDEVALAPFDLQHKLLRFIESGEIVRVGGTEAVKIDARIIAASNIDLESLVKEGRFRNDLYYRLKVVPLALPPLKDRTEDIPFLIRHFLDQINTRFNTDKVIGGQAMEALVRYDWPGNVREVENLVERLVVMTPHQTVDLADLPETMFEAQSLLPTLVEGRSLKETVREFEAQLVEMAVKKYGSQAKAAEALGISQASITRKRRAVS
jgi:PAS domain S-box-containing protein